MHYEKRIDPRRRMMNRALSEPYFADEGWNEVYVDRTSVVPLF